MSIISPKSLLFTLSMFFLSASCMLEAAVMKLSSKEFSHQGFIPKKFTCKGENISPELKITDIPAAAKSLVLIVDDPDAPVGDWVHWVLYDIPPTTTTIKENSPIGIAGMNDFKKNAYGGPCPPSGTHRYFFKMYALDTKLNLPQGKTKKQIEEAMQSHIIERAEYVGLFSSQ